MARRIVCAEGCGAWWYYDAPKGGRPRIRCPRCAAVRAERIHAENRRNWHWKRKQLRLAGVSP